MTLTLPWPPSLLSPNCAKHWRAKLKAKDKYKADCLTLALATKLELPQGNIHLYVVFHPPTKRRFDLDNSLASIKYGLDSVALAWGIDDIRFRPITVDMGYPIKSGKIMVSIIEL
jgi:crossover junction endodeoxyribonuclease RusA